MQLNANPQTAYETLVFDGGNSYPDCECCGHCCRLNVLALTAEEVRRMHAYAHEHGVRPTDQNGERCPFAKADNRCSIWEARPQPCQLHHCRVPRTEVLRQNPDIKVPEDLMLVNLHEEFVAGHTGQWVKPIA